MSTTPNWTQCACGNPAREGIDHSKHVCTTAGFFTPEDFARIERAAAKEDEA